MTTTDHRAQNLDDSERFVSIVGGAALILTGVLRPSGLRTILALGGAELLRRGLTGHCAVYQSLGIDHSEKAPEHHRTYGYGKRGEHSLKDEIDEASADSFPASDPPAWSPTSVGRPATAD